jgi:hypothetical protein
LAAGVLSTASIPASAATIVEDFSIFSLVRIPSADANYTSSSFAGFDPSLGTLTGATISYP